MASTLDKIVKLILTDLIFSLESFNRVERPPQGAFPRVHIKKGTSISVTTSVTHPCVTKIEVVTKIGVYFYDMNLHKKYMPIPLLQNTHVVTTFKT